MDDKKLNQLHEHELQKAREKKLREKKAWHSLQEILFYFIFVWILFIVCFSQKDNSAFTYQTMLRRTFGIDSDSFKDVKITCFEICLL
jgi:hypothetical protein